MSPIATDFLQTYRFERIVNRTGNVKVIALLGGMVGNFREDDIFDVLETSASERDYILIDAEFHMGRSEQELLSGYRSEEAMQFMFGPVEDLGYEGPGP